jgi:hypothetical protein
MSVAFAGVTAMSEKVKVTVLYYYLHRCIPTVEGERGEEPIEEYALTSEQDAALFEQEMDDAAGWMRICSFRTREDAVKYVEECLSRSAEGDQPRNRPSACPGGTAAAERTVTRRRGTHTAEQHEVLVVYGEDDTVRGKVEGRGMDAAIHSYPFSTEQDAAEFERALENHHRWWENDTFRTREEAVECLMEYLS